MLRFPPFEIHNDLDIHNEANDFRNILLNDNSKFDYHGRKLNV